MSKEGNFDALIQAIQEAFIKVNNMSEMQHMTKIQDHFDENGKPKCIELSYPYFDENGVSKYRQIKVPQICLMPMSSLKLDEIDVDFKVRLYGGVRLKEVGDSEEPDVNKSNAMLKTERKWDEKNTFLGYIPQSGRRFGKDENYANIRLKFVSNEPPEGLMRIQDQYTKVTL